MAAKREKLSLIAAFAVGILLAGVWLLFAPGTSEKNELTAFEGIDDGDFESRELTPPAQTADDNAGTRADPSSPAMPTVQPDTRPILSPGEQTVPEAPNFTPVAGQESPHQIVPQSPNGFPPPQSELLGPVQTVPGN